VKARAFRCAASLALAGLLAGCLELDAPRPALPREPAFPDPASDAALVDVTITGEDAERDDWARAVTISRFFATRVENRSGTLAELLRPAVAEALRRRGYRRVPADIADADADAANNAKQSARARPDLALRVRIDRAELLWLPPQEFIQTPTPRRDGRVRLDFRLHAQLGVAEDDAIVFAEDWSAMREVPVTPGSQARVMGELTTETLRAFALFLANELPREKTLEKKTGRNFGGEAPAKRREIP